MAVTFACGFECATISSDWTPNNAVFDTTVAGRNGARVARVDVSGAAQCYIATGTGFNGGSGGVWPTAAEVVRFRFRMSALPTSEALVSYIGTSVAAAPTFYIDENGRIRYAWGNASGNSANGAIVPNVWYTLQFWADGPNKTSGWMLDGVTMPSPANASVADTFTTLYIGKLDGADHGTFSVYVDDAVLGNALTDYPFAYGAIGWSGTAEFLDQSAYRDAVTTDSPVAYYRMGESTGSVIDTMGGTSGSTSGTVTRDVTGALLALDDGAITLNGTTGLITVPDQDRLDPGDTFSLEVWVKRAATGDMWILSKSTGGYGLSIQADHTVALLRDDFTLLAHSSVTITDTTVWHHIVATKSGSTRNIYVDGKDVTVLDTNDTVTATTSSLFIGAYHGTASFFNGTVDEVAIYNYVLQPDRVKTHFLRGRGAIPALAVAGRL